MAPFEPAPQQPVVVVSGDDDDLASAPEGRAELAQHRRAGRERVANRPVPQLERVAEEHEAVELGEARAERRPLAVTAQHIRPAVRAEVKVRDDQGAQRSTRTRSWPPRPGGSPWGA